MTEGQTGFFRRQWKQDGPLGIISRLILGLIFIYASMDKIARPASFAKDIYNYQILPDALINLPAMVLPWLELILGIFLVVGLFREGTAWMVTLLLVVFFGALVFNLARGLDIHCGCFHSSAQGTDGPPMAWYVFRDGLFLVPAFYLFYCTFRGGRNPGESSGSMYKRPHFVNQEGTSANDRQDENTVFMHRQFLPESDGRGVDQHTERRAV